MLGYVAECLCVHLYQLTLTASHCYIHVNMAKAEAVAVALLYLNLPDREAKMISVKQIKKSRALHRDVLAMMRRGGGSAQSVSRLQLSNVGWMTLWLSG